MTQRRGRFGIFGAAGSGEPPSRGYEHDREDEWFFRLTTFRVLGALAVVWSLWTCWFIVGNAENSVIQRFGRHVRTEEPGLRFKLPWPIESATEVNVQEVRRIEIGFRTTKVGPPAEYQDVPEEQEMLTGDTNIAELDFIVQYRKSDAAKWLFSVENPEEAISLVAQSAMRMVIGGSTFDDVATTGRAPIQEQTEKITQELANQLGLGATIIAVQLQDAHPPEKVMAAFKDVSSAKEDKDRLTREAEGYRDKQIPEARGTAKKVIEESLAYKEQRIRAARGDADRFLQVLAKYQQSPTITLERLRLEAIEQTLTGKGQLVDLSGGEMLKYYNAQALGVVAQEKK